MTGGIWHCPKCKKESIGLPTSSEDERARAPFCEKCGVSYVRGPAYSGRDCPYEHCGGKGTVFRCPERKAEVVDYVCLACLARDPWSRTCMTGMIFDEAESDVLGGEFWRDTPEISLDLYNLVETLARSIKPCQENPPCEAKFPMLPDCPRNYHCPYYELRHDKDIEIEFHWHDSKPPTIIPCPCGETQTPVKDSWNGKVISVCTNCGRTVSRVDAEVEQGSPPPIDMNIFDAGRKLLNEINRFGRTSIVTAEATLDFVRKFPIIRSYLGEG